MRYRNILGTDLYPSPICLGTQSMGSAIDRKHSFQLLDTFFEMGGNFIDTAHVYGDWVPGEKSLSEKTIGMWVKERGIRSKIMIGTKGAHPALSSMNIPRLSHDEIVKDVNESLECLQTDYIDLYWLHRDDPNRPVADILETLNEQVAVGKIKYFGCSNWKVQRIREAMEYASKHELKCFVGNQMMWSLAVPNIDAIGDKSLVIMDKEGMEFHRKTHLTAIPYSSQAKGFFTKMSKGNIRQLSERIKKTYYNEENMKRLERIEKLAHDLSRSVTEIVLSYLISQPFITIPIVGCRTVEQLTESLQAGNLRLDPDMVRYLEEGN